MLRAALAILLMTSGLAQGRDLVLAIGGEPEAGFDPTLGWGAYGNPLFQSTLLRRDANLQSQMDLAEALELSQDRLTWTIRLRQGVKFSDGSALTAQDVAFTFNQAKVSAGAVDIQVMREARALDDVTLLITLDRPWITFAEAFHSLGVVPANSYGPNYGRNPIGSGPYQMKSWAEGEQLIVTRNPHYYGAKGEFDQITFLFTDEATGLAAAQAGQAQIVALPAQLADVEVAGYRAVSVKSVDNRGLSLPYLPQNNPVTSDLALRKAINLALDREVIAEVASYGHARAAFGPADGLPWGGDLAYTPDPKASAELLEAAGWVLQADGIRQKEGHRAAFDIYYPASDSTRQALAEVTAALLLPLGIEARPKGASWEVIGQNMHHQPVIFGFGSHSPYQIFSIYAQRLGGVEYANPTFYGNEKLEALFEAAQSAPSLEASYPIWAQGAQYYGAQGDNAWAWLVNLDHVYLTDQCLDLGRLQIEPHGHGWPITANLADWHWTC